MKQLTTGEMFPLMQNVIKKYRHPPPGGKTPPAKKRAGLHNTTAGRTVPGLQEKIELMSERYANGLDLWTGEPLDEVGK